MSVLVREGLYDADYVQGDAVGFDPLRSDVLPDYDSERVAAITGVPATDVERLAHLYGESRAPFVYLGMGLSHQPAGGWRFTPQPACRRWWERGASAAGRPHDDR